MIVLVCGGRNCDEREVVFKVLDRLHAFDRITRVLHGGCRGADALAGDWAFARGVDQASVLPDWTTHGKAAGPIRNQQLLDMNPDVVVAFSGGRGTADMVRRASMSRIRVLEIAKFGQPF